MRQFVIHFPKHFFLSQSAFPKEKAITGMQKYTEILTRVFVADDDTNLSPVVCCPRGSYYFALTG